MHKQSWATDVRALHPRPYATSPAQAQNWTLDLLRSTPQRRFMKSHANLKGLPVGAAKGLKVSLKYHFLFAPNISQSRRLPSLTVAYRQPGMFHFYIRCVCWEIITHLTRSRHTVGYAFEQSIYCTWVCLRLHAPTVEIKANC